MEDANEVVNKHEKPMECSDMDEDSQQKESAVVQRICLIGNLSTDEEVLEAAKKFQVPLEFSQDGSEWLDSPLNLTVFVLEEFTGPLFDDLRSLGHRVLGPTALKEIAEKNMSLLCNTRPLYSLAMYGLIICFTGFRSKEELARLILLIHNMGGSIRKTINAKITHLIANTCVSEKYHYATNFRVPVMSAMWVHNAWALRTQLGFSAALDTAEHRLKPFHGARVCFLGFHEDEQKHMSEILIENGGHPTDIDDPTCSHLVLDSEETYELIAKEFIPAIKRRRRASALSSPGLDVSLHEPRHSSTPVSHVLSSQTSDRSAEEGVEGPFETPRRPRGEPSPPRKGSFKTPRLSAVRRSLRIKAPSVISKWISSLDVSLGRHEPALVDSCEVRPGPEDQADSMNHSVVDECSVNTMPQQAPPNAYVVKAEWFWGSVQKQHCIKETFHLYQEAAGSGTTTPHQSLSSTTPCSTRARKRKRLNLVKTAGSSPAPEASKRRSSVTDATLLSCSGSFLDSSHPDIQEGEVEIEETPRKNLSARHQVFLELLQTETNYVGILNTIMSLFKSPLEEVLESDEQLLNATELKIIFGNLPPIYHIHCEMLDQFRHTAHNWKEDTSIGNIFLKFAPDLVKAYPPFVNYFENTREMLNKCDENKPRFHAFLKVRQTKPECGRQTLHELLIRPVQRLPSISLLLTDMLKHTNKNNPDYSALEKAISSIKEVMTHINEDKRKTEGQMVIFNIFNDIENCPPHLISSHRSFINKCEVTEVSDSLSKKGDPLVLYLFSDMLEVCKKRSRVFNSLKSPNATMSGKVTNNKPYKHIKLINLATIRKVIDIRETEECRNVFALMCFSTQDLKEKLYTFVMTEEDVDKMMYLKTLCRHTANNTFLADSENILASIDPETLQIDTSDVGLGTLGKAFKFASRTRIKVGRALSFNKTPSKLKRAMSTMMSPFGSTTNLMTPATQLAQMRLASCTNINELSGSSSPAQPQYQAPMSVQPTRRSKHSSISVASLRRL